MFADADFILPCTTFLFKATESKVEPQMNSNGDAIKCKKTENLTTGMFMYYSDSVKTFDYSLKVNGTILKQGKMAN